MVELCQVNSPALRLLHLFLSFFFFSSACASFFFFLFVVCSVVCFSFVHVALCCISSGVMSGSCKMRPQHRAEEFRAPIRRYVGDKIVCRQGQAYAYLVRTCELEPGKEKQWGTQMTMNG